MDAAERAAGESAVKQLAAIVIATPNRVPQAKPPQSPRYGVEVSRISNPPNFRRIYKICRLIVYAGFNFPAHRNLRVSEGVENLLR